MDSKFIEIKFEYKEKLFTIKSELYTTIKELKRKAIKKFHDIPKDIHCFYLSRDLSSYENETVGELFNNREKVTLKLMPEKKSMFNNKKLSDKKNNEKFFSDFYMNTNVYSSGFNNIGRFKNKKIKLIGSKDKKGIKSINKEDIVLPIIKKTKEFTEQNEENSFNEDYDLSNSNTDENIDEENICENCCHNQFCEYCRNCKEFVCSNCKKDEQHKNHFFIHLNSNYESNIRIYGNLLLTDIDFFKKQNDIINENEDDIINHCVSEQNIKELYNKHDTLINKLKEVLKMYECIINELKKELIIEGENKIKEYINDYNNNSEKINNDINKLFKQLEREKENLNIGEFKYYFEEMSENEDKLNGLNKKIIKYHLVSQLNNKLVSMMNNIEQIVNEINEDQDNPFNLSPYFKAEFLNLINNSKKKEDNENNENYINNKINKTYRSSLFKKKEINEDNSNDKYKENGN